MKRSSHVHHKDDPKSVACFVLTVSDTRDPRTDESGRTIIETLEGAGHKVAGYAIVKDEPKQIISTIRKAVENLPVAVVIVNGGTGIAPRDSTIEALKEILTKEIPGFGELFRYLSYKEIGAAAMLSRAVGGVFRGSVVFSIPGSPAAVRLALNQLILPQLNHIVGEVLKNRNE
ncbi:MAG TPA: MogA/MoaB family molybdenum cofactor biosynthesis protein [Bdellovibrionota bacterium]|nr:MogA/MoaB family molybdenum cofactor biosynthesis protein [Bdellovibrionota bacterium]